MGGVREKEAERRGRCKGKREAKWCAAAECGFMRHLMKVPMEGTSSAIPVAMECSAFGTYFLSRDKWRILGY